MRYTKFIGSDADECIQGFKKLSESLRNSLEILRKIMSENSVNEEGYEILSEAEKTLVRQRGSQAFGEVRIWSQLHA